MKIRVAHIVNPTFGTVFSGHTHYLFSLLSGWQGEEISLDLYGPKIKPLNMNSGNQNYKLPNGTFWSNPQRLDRKGRIRWTFDLLHLLIKRRNEYDIAHFHSLGWGGLLSPLLLHLLDKKVVFTMSLFGNDNPSHILGQPRGRLQVALMRNFDGAIGLSPALVEDAKSHDINNVICLRNFLAIPQLEEEIKISEMEEIRKSICENFGIPRNSKLLLFIGAIIHRKGVDVLIDTFIKLSQKHKDQVLVLVGPKSKEESTHIDEDYVSKLQNKINQANLKSKVLWIGMVRDQSKLVELYRTADIFVFPTRNEGSPNVLAEAMAAGLPVVTSLLPGITDGIVSEGESGCLVDPITILTWNIS